MDTANEPMEQQVPHFTNAVIDTKNLPRYESVEMTSLEKRYWNVVLITIGLFALLFFAGFAILWFTIDEDKPNFFYVVSLFVLLTGLAVGLSRVSFRKKGYAFREHDVLFRHGIIATNTMIIPYNRVQHVAVHEGFISRFFGLAKVEIFTAGGNSGDIEIPGIEKSEAENIKQLLMGKIHKPL